MSLNLLLHRRVVCPAVDVEGFQKIKIRNWTEDGQTHDHTSTDLLSA